MEPPYFPYIHWVKSVFKKVPPIYIPIKIPIIIICAPSREGCGKTFPAIDDDDEIKKEKGIKNTLHLTHSVPKV